MVVLGGGAVSYEQGTPVGPYGDPRSWAVSHEQGTPVQGFLAHKEQPPRRTLE